MSDQRSEWATLVRNGDQTPWFFADVPTEEEASIWLPAMYAVAEAIAQRLQLPEDVLSRLLQAAGEAMSKCTVHTSPLEEQRLAVAAAVRALDELTATSQHNDVATTQRGGHDVGPA